MRGRRPPRWLAILIVFVASFVALVFLVLHVIPPMVGEVEEVAKHGPAYVQDLEEWANDSGAFQELNEKYDLTEDAERADREDPGRARATRPSELEDISVGLLKNLISAAHRLVLAFFLLLEGPGMLDRFLTWLGGERERRGRRMVAGRLRRGPGLRDDQRLARRSPPACSRGACSRSSASTSPSRWRS